MTPAPELTGQHVIVPQSLFIALCACYFGDGPKHPSAPPQTVGGVQDYAPPTPKVEEWRPRPVGMQTIVPSHWKPGGVAVKPVPVESKEPDGNL